MSLLWELMRLRLVNQSVFLHNISLEHLKRSKSSHTYMKLKFSNKYQVLSLLADQNVIYFIAQAVK
jgi:hypothetical protein